MSEAPRWRLTNPHYLKVPFLPDGTRVEWEHKETSRESGRSVRKLYPVPILLNPNDPADCNYPGEIIVAHGDADGITDRQQDIVFIGDPTPEMEPLNDAAQAITDSLRPKWENPIESLPANGGMSGEESAFMAKMMEAFAKAAPPPAPSDDSVNELKERIARLESLLAAKSGASSAPERRA